jgi:16S rRNA (uracil1498-N3)-methyltransferase
VARVYFNAHLEAGQAYRLSDEAARHVQVLRMQPGMHLDVFNGLGGYFDATIEVMDKQGVSVKVLSFHTADHAVRCHTHLVIGMPANERMDWLVEKATELGVSHITPLHTQHTVLRLSGERALKRQQHWQGIAHAACAQSGRNRVPQIDAPMSLSDWIHGLPETAAHPRVMLSFQAGAFDWRDWWSTPPAQLTLLSGPEGGLSPEEETLAQSKGFVPVLLGPRVMRAETAPLAVLEIAATYAPYASIILITLQQFLTESKEIRMGDTIIFQNNSCIYLPKKPTYCPANTKATALIDFTIKALDLTRPINLFSDEIASGSNSLYFAGALQVGTVTSYKNP